MEWTVAELKTAYARQRTDRFSDMDMTENRSPTREVEGHMRN